MQCNIYNLIFMINLSNDIMLYISLILYTIVTQ